MKKYISLACLFLLCACASQTVEQPQTAEALYNKAQSYMQKTDYKNAAKTFEQLELEYPYSKLSVKAKLFGAYAYYNEKQYDDALLSVDRFIKFHPGNKEIAYAYYLKALCYYDQISSVEKEQENTQKAKEALGDVIKRFPNSKYAKDAKNKMILVNDHLAGKEMEVGRFYLNKNNYLSALNRFSEVVKKYRNTSHAPEALYRQTELYTILGLKNEATVAAKILKYNYPKSSWTKKALKIVE